MKIQYEVSVSIYNVHGYNYQDIEITPICRNCKNCISPMSGKNTALVYPSCGLVQQFKEENDE